MLVGRDAAKALDRICANDVAKPPGHLTYTQMLNARGGIECDLTVARLDADDFYIVTGTGFATHDFDWIQRSIPSGMNAQLFDITSANTVLSLMGPLSRDILRAVTSADVSNESFPFGTQQIIGIAGCPVRALRVTYVGELGWELHLPVEYATTVYDALMRSGAETGLVNAGYRAWGSDIGPDHSPIEAGLSWAVKLRSEIDFRGREAVAAQRRDGVRKMFAGFTCDPEVVLLGRETIYRDGRRVGWLTSGGYGYTIGRSIGYGYVRASEGVTADFVISGTYELEVAGTRVAAEVSLHPFYDPTNARVKS
jgi:4-methylaminobutanoate oxidase (formaldehyde-forming)